LDFSRPVLLISGRGPVSGRPDLLIAVNAVTCNTVVDSDSELQAGIASTSQCSSVRPAVSIEHRLATDDSEVQRGAAGRRRQACLVATTTNLEEHELSAFTATVAAPEHTTL